MIHKDPNRMIHKDPNRMIHKDRNQMIHKDPNRMIHKDPNQIFPGPAGLGLLKIFFRWPKTVPFVFPIKVIFKNISH